MLDPTAEHGEVVVSLRSDDSALLSLPWEAARVGGLGPLALIERVSTVRALDVERRGHASVQGPLRILVAVAAPGDDLDLEHEMSSILDAVERTRAGRARVVFIDDADATLDAIVQQLKQEPFHVLHISAHGGPGALQLEDAQGNAARVTAQALVAALQHEHIPQRPPVVVLSACSSAAAPRSDDLDRLDMASALLHSGVRHVLAMQGPVGDGYAAELAGAFYQRLAEHHEPTPARALAEARREVERLRAEHASNGQRYRASEPEYATPVLLSAAGTEGEVLFDATHPWELVSEPPARVDVPGLDARPLGWVVGRRRLRRRLRAIVTDQARKGAVVWGMGGNGKSTLAASVCGSLRRSGWGVAVHVGRVSLSDIARAVVQQVVGEQKLELETTEGKQRIEELRPATIPGQEPADDVLLPALRVLLERERIVVLLDNFEDNLHEDPDATAALPSSLRVGTDRYRAKLPAAMARLLPLLGTAAKRGALLITCRYELDLPTLPLASLDLPQLHDNALRRFAWRLPNLLRLPDRERVDVLRKLGGHPRVLEFADAYLGQEQGAARFDDILRRIERLADRRTKLPDAARKATAAEQLAFARRLAAEDVLLEKLLNTLTEPTRRFLEAIAVYRRGVPDEALQAVGEAAGLSWDEDERDKAVRALESRTLLLRTGPGGESRPRPWEQSWMVHRWTAAELLPDGGDATVHEAAARWWLKPRPVAWDDAGEGVEHLLAAGLDDEASALAGAMTTHAAQSGMQLVALALAERMVDVFPDPVRGRANWLMRLGDQVRHLRNFDEARSHYDRSLELSRQLAAAEPEDSDLLRDIGFVLDRLGGLLVANGDGDGAMRYFEESLGIDEELVAREPGRSDLQRDLSVSYNKLGDLHRALGNGQLALRYFEDSLAIAKELVAREPDNYQAQSDLAQSFARMAAVEPEKASSWLDKSVLIQRRRLEQQPNNVFTAVELAIVLFQLGQVHGRASRMEPASAALAEAHALFEKLEQIGALDVRYKPMLDSLNNAFSRSG
ncbi:MAG: CHAT domain-containing protein [Nannocystaceae bacterium]